MWVVSREEHGLGENAREQKVGGRRRKCIRVECYKGWKAGGNGEIMQQYLIFCNKGPVIFYGSGGGAGEILRVARVVYNDPPPLYKKFFGVALCPKLIEMTPPPPRKKKRERERIKKKLKMTN